MQPRSFKAYAAQLGTRESRKLQNNTYLQRRDADTLAIRLHATDVLTFKRDGRVVYDDGGWQTVTTKDRMNEFGPALVFSDKGIWYLRVNAEDGERWSKERASVYQRGIMVRGTRVYHAASRKARDANAKLKRDVAKYAAEFIRELEANKIPAPGPGDCFYCQMRTDDGRTLGESSGDQEHMRSHLSESYYVPSLAVRAIETFCNAPVMQWYLWGRFVGGLAMTPQSERDSMRRASSDEYTRKRAERAIRRYVGRQLGMAV